MNSYLKSAKASVSSRVHAKAAPSKAKPTIVEDVAPKPDAEVPPMFEGLEGFLRGYNIVLPSTTRWVVSLVCSAIAGGVLGYAGGTLLSYCMAGALIYTGSALLAFLIYIVGLVLLAFAGWHTGRIVGGFILSGDIDRCYQKCSDTVLSGFGSLKNKMAWSAS